MPSTYWQPGHRRAQWQPQIERKVEDVFFLRRLPPFLSPSRRILLPTPALLHQEHFYNGQRSLMFEQISADDSSHAVQFN